MTGVDVVISKVTTVFGSHLWPNVSNREFKGRAYRTKKNGKTIAEVFKGGSDYEDIRFNDSLNVLSFFDVGERIENVYELPKREVNIIFSVKTTAVYPSLGYRVTEELYADVINVLETHFYGLITINSIISGLNAYGDLDTTELKAYDMQPWHVFSLNTEFIINYKNC